MKGVGMLVVSPSVENFGFCSHLGSRLGLHAKKYKNICLIYDDAFKNYLWVKVFEKMSLPSLKVTVFFICLCFNMVSFRGQKKLGPRPDRFSFRGFKISDEHPRPFRMRDPPR